MLMHTMGKRTCPVVITLLLCARFFSGHSQSFECPSNWHRHGGSCYLFHSDNTKTYEASRFSCMIHGAGLLSVGGRQEHEFVVKLLQVLDTHLQQWYTSGIRESSTRETATFVWHGSGQEVSGPDQFWVPGQDFNSSVGVIVYKPTEGGYQWSVTDPSEKHLYICELPEAEAYRVLQDHRDYDYGLHHTDINQVDRGPHFILQPHSTLVVGTPPTLTLECVAAGLPQPTYTWWKGENYEVLLTYDTDKRYSFTNGKLTISNPAESRDSGLYRCQAHNPSGMIISDGIEVSFGDIGEFSNVPDAAVNAKAYEGAAIDCSRITYKPAVTYQWFTRGTDQFVRPQFQSYMFVSLNGKLYFSEVTRADEGKYYCMATLTGVDKYTIGTSQPPTRTSLPKMLHVHDTAPIAEWGPVIQNEFIGVHPRPPMVGQDVKLECFAYGSSTTEFHYHWSRDHKSLPKKSFLADHNRLLVIRDASLDDQGVYTCHVSRGSSAKDFKSVDLKLGAKPYFTSPLRDQHVDVGSQFTWRCDARSSPAAYFHWYRNGQPLYSNPDQYLKVIGNVLLIQHLDPDLHNGMYQCAATNHHGTSMSEGQLRVLAFPPNFYKYPMQAVTQASVLGNLTLRCQPQGAPLPSITWYKNGVELEVTSDGAIQISQGYLVLTSISQQFQGRYTCRASNIFGQAEVNTSVTVTERTYITVAPHDQTVSINSTIFLYCQASHPSKMDLIYSWLFNGQLIDRVRNPEYRPVQSDETGKSGLYIIAAQLHHSGLYQCVATTTGSSDSKAAYLTIVGPPSEPAGVVADATTVTTTSIIVRWTDGWDSGRAVSNYIIEAANVFETDEWHTAVGDVAAVDTIPLDGRKRFVQVTNLNPGCGYRFRVIAVNQLGASPPSSPSAYIQTLSAAPRLAPACVGGGDGRVGDLTMTWMPLTRAQQAGDGIGYRLYWRRQSQGHHGDDGAWSVKEVIGNWDHFVTQVGADNYYLEYDFKIQAFNNLGFGPNSSQVTIMSAEDLPVATATNVAAEGYNGTAVEVSWTPVPKTREYARGKILGYQINYWHEEEQMTDWKDFIRHEGQVDTGLVIGLKSDNFYYFTIQVYNSAGLGPRSEYFFQETLHFPASQYPEEIRVYSASGNHVEVWWRGIHISQPEGNIYGFVIYYWPASEHYRTACQHVVHDHHAHHAHIEVDPGVVYALRVSAFGEGGYGKKSLTTYFTLEGNNVLVDHNLALTVDTFRSAASSLPTPARLASVTLIPIIVFSLKI